MIFFNSKINQNILGIIYKYFQYKARIELSYIKFKMEGENQKGPHKGHPKGEHQGKPHGDNQKGPHQGERPNKEGGHQGGPHQGGPHQGGPHQGEHQQGGPHKKGNH